MCIANIPTPKHSLGKYSTKQLLAWYETCYLFEALADDYYKKNGYYTDEHWAGYPIARWMRWDIDDKLQERGVSHLKLGEILGKIHDDVFA